jgi:inosose dehydratase
MMATKIAGAPISWGVCEVPGWGHQMGRERVLAEMRELGLGATEAGPDGFLPDDPNELRELLSASEMTLASGFTPLVLHGKWRAQLQAVARRFHAGGADIIVLAAATGLDDYDARPQLTEADWTRVLRALDHARHVAGEHGLRVALHPHYGTIVETPEEIERVLDGCDVPLCLDTGHVALGGGDPVAIARQAPERIAHLHLKDVDADLAAQVVAGTLTFSDAVRSGVFLPLGHGDIDLHSVLADVHGAGYDGWYVFEQDAKLEQEPQDDGGPREDVARSLAFLEGALLTTP